MKSKLTTLIGCVIASSAVLFLWWRAQFGVELYDEPLYLLSGFKLFAEGDLPLAHEAHNGLRQYDVLNHALVSPFAPLEVLYLRRLAVGLYAVLLGAFTWLCFRRSFGLAAGMAFATCLIFDHFLFATWSHNWWVRNLCLLHHCLLLSASGKHEKRGYVLAGAVMGLVVFAYHPLVFAVALSVLCLLLIWVLPSRRTERPQISFYLSGLFAVGAAIVVYLSREPVRTAWLHAVSVNVIDYVAGEKIGPDKFKNVASLIVFGREVWIMGLLLILGTRALPLYSRFKVSYAVRERIGAGLAAIFAIFLLKRLWDSSYFFMISQLFIALGAVGGAVALVTGKAGARLVLLTLLPFLLLVNMSFVSHNSHHALFWLVPLLLVPFIASQMSLATDRFLAARFMLFLSAVTIVLVGSVRYSLSQTYFDAPPAECTTAIESGPLKNIRTTPRRARLIGELARAAEDRSFAVSIGLPGLFYFGHLRSSADSTVLNPSFPDQIAQGALRTMVRDRRFPELVVIERQNNWGWGKEAIPAILEEKHPYARFARCVSRGVLFDFPEMYVLEADPGRAERCAENAFDFNLGSDIS